MDKLRVLVMVLGLSACHDNLNSNQAMQHAWMLDERASCLNVARNTDRYGDIAECDVRGNKWICYSSPKRCYVMKPVQLSWSVEQIE